MLRCAHFEMKGGELPFAAICTSDRSADKLSFRCGCTNGRFRKLEMRRGFD